MSFQWTDRQRKSAANAVQALSATMQRSARWMALYVRDLKHQPVFGSLTSALSSASSLGSGTQSDLEHRPEHVEDTPLFFLDQIEGIRVAFLHGASDLYPNGVTPSVFAELFSKLLISGRATAPLARVALQGITKVLNDGVFDNDILGPLPRDDPELGIADVIKAIELSSVAIARCSYESGDATADEHVMTTLCQATEALVTSDPGRLLSDESLCSLVERVLVIACNNRATESLRLTASSCLSNCVVHVASSLAEDEYVLPRSAYTAESIAEMVQTLAAMLNPEATSNTERMRLIAIEVLLRCFETTGSHIATIPAVRSHIRDALLPNLFAAIQADNAVLHEPALRLSLCILQSACEPLFVEMFVCICAMRLNINGFGSFPMDTGDHSDINIELPSSLTIAPETWQRVKAIAGPCRPAPVPTRRWFLHALITIATWHPSAVPALWSAFDCSVRRINILQLVVQVLCHNTLLNDSALDVKQALAAIDHILHSLVHLSGMVNNNDDADDDATATSDLRAFIGQAPQSSANRSDLVRRQLDATSIAPEAFRVQASASLAEHQLKEKFTAAAVEFNVKPTRGIEALHRDGLISSSTVGDLTDDDLDVISQFLFFPGLDKATVGDWIARPASVRVLERFFASIDLSGMRIDEALRVLLVHFRLPGEGQMVDRIMDAFSARFHAIDASGLIDTPSAAHRLAYAIIMLHTDLHNPNIDPVRRMTLTDFQRMLRGTNDGMGDFDAQFLSDIYDGMKAREMVLSGEHDGRRGFDAAVDFLKAQLRPPSLSTLTGTLLPLPVQSSSDNAALYGAIFEQVSTLLVDAYSRVFSSCSDDAFLISATHGLEMVCRLSLHYRLPTIAPNIVQQLASLSHVLEPVAQSDLHNPLEYTVPNIDSSDSAGKRSVVFTNLGLLLGRSYRSQISLLVMTQIARAFTNALDDGAWSFILHITESLMMAGLLSSDLTSISTIASEPSANAEEYVVVNTDIDSLLHLAQVPLRDPIHRSRATASASDQSIFSFLRSATSPTSSSPDPQSRWDAPTSALLEWIDAAQSTVAACGFGQLLDDLSIVETDILRRVVELIIQRIRSISDEAAGSIPGNGTVGAAPESIEPIPHRRVASASTPPTRTSADSTDMTNARRRSASPGPSARTVADQTPPSNYSSAIVFWIEQLVRISTANRGRIAEFWDLVSELIVDVVDNGAIGMSVATSEHTDPLYHPLAVIHTLRSVFALSGRICHEPSLLQPVFATLEPLASDEGEVSAALGRIILNGTVDLVRNGQPSAAFYVSAWPVFRGLLLNAGMTSPSAFAQVTAIALELAAQLADGRLSPAENLLSSVVNLLSWLISNHPQATAAPGTPSPTAILDTVLTLHSATQVYRESARLDDDRLWNEVWRPTLSTFARHCSIVSSRNPALPDHALRLLSTSLSTLPEEAFVDSTAAWTVTFDTALLPTITVLAAYTQQGNKSADDVLLRLMSTTSSFFLRSLPMLSIIPDVSQLKRLWGNILDTFLLITAVPRSATQQSSHALSLTFQAETALECIKNMVLVMNATDMLLDPDTIALEDVDGDADSGADIDSTATELWEITWSKLTPAFPSLRDELFPASPTAPQPESIPEQLEQSAHPHAEEEDVVQLQQPNEHAEIDTPPLV
ncbi:hypothetical protein GQ42DRAFT_132518 [Ramicandelaber brevisporus]|nr:hypothetical protein GQ42DRAFT_132518 [Ramicandelaber brevisporus]